VPAGVPCAAVRGLDEVLADPQLAAREMIQAVRHPAAGPLKVLGVPIKLSDTPGAVDRPPPRLGEHTAAVLQQVLGVSAQEIAELRAGGVLGAAQAE